MVALLLGRGSLTPPSSLPLHRSDVFGNSRVAHLAFNNRQPAYSPANVEDAGQLRSFFILGIIFAISSLLAAVFMALRKYLKVARKRVKRLHARTAEPQPQPTNVIATPERSRRLEPHSEPQFERPAEPLERPSGAKPTLSPPQPSNSLPPSVDHNLRDSLTNNSSLWTSAPKPLPGPDDHPFFQNLKLRATADGIDSNSNHSSESNGSPLTDHLIIRPHKVDEAVSNLNPASVKSFFPQSTPTVYPFIPAPTITMHRPEPQPHTPPTSSLASSELSPSSGKTVAATTSSAINITIATATELRHPQSQDSSPTTPSLTQPDSTTLDSSPSNLAPEPPPALAAGANATGTVQGSEESVRAGAYVAHGRTSNSDLGENDNPECRKDGGADGASGLNAETPKQAAVPAFKDQGIPSPPAPRCTLTYTRSLPSGAGAMDREEETEGERAKQEEGVGRDVLLLHGQVWRGRGWRRHQWVVGGGVC